MKQDPACANRGKPTPQTTNPQSEPIVRSKTIATNALRQERSPNFALIILHRPIFATRCPNTSAKLPKPTMKFDTKKATPVNKDSPHSYISPNKFIPESKDDNTSGLGRKQFYEVFLVATPELKSTRIQDNTSESKRVVNEDGLDQLNELLNKLHLDDSPKFVVTPKSVSTEKKHAIQPKHVSFDDGFGRKESRAYSFKSGRVVTVKRSARLA